MNAISSISFSKAYPQQSRPLKLLCMPSGKTKATLRELAGRTNASIDFALHPKQ